MFSKGKYFTKSGLVATIARIIPGKRWNLMGVVTVGNILHLHAWSFEGISITGDSTFNLVRRT